MQLSDPITARPTSDDVRHARRLIADDVHLLVPMESNAAWYAARRLDQRDTDRILDAVLSSPEGRAALRTLLAARCA